MPNKKINRKVPQKGKSVSSKKGFFITDHYILFLTIFLIPVFLIYFLNSKSISTFVIQISFIVALIPLAIYAAYLSSKGKFNLGTLPGFVIITGILLRVIYTIYTPFTLRQHDVIGSSFNHLDYIKLIANQLSLPDVGYCQAYHPPVHHALSAVFYSIGKAFGFSEFNSFRLVQLFMVFLSCLTLIYVYKILKLVNCSDTVVLAGVSIFAFYPYNIYFASFLNNDNTLFFFYTLSFYYLLKWIYNKTLKNMIILSVLVSLSILTKKPAVIILPVIFVVFMVVLYQNRKSYKPYLKQYFIFAAIAAPLSLSHTIRNYIMFKQGFFYTPGVSFVKYPNNPFTLFYIPFKELFNSPYTVDPFSQDPNSTNQFFTDYVIKSSLFGEWRFPGLETIASILILATLAIIIITVIYLIIENKKILNGYGYIFLLNLILPYLLLFQSRLSNPVVCAQNFRYAALMLISVAYFYGKAAEKFSQKKFNFLKYVIIACTVAFCLLSTLFILQIGAAPADAYNFQ